LPVCGPTIWRSRRAGRGSMCRVSDRLDVLDARTGKRVARLRTGNRPHDVHATPDNHRIFNASLGNMQEEDEAARGATENADDP